MDYAELLGPGPPRRRLLGGGGHTQKSYDKKDNESLGLRASCHNESRGTASSKLLRMAICSPTILAPADEGNIGRELWTSASMVFDASEGREWLGIFGVLDGE